MNKRELMLQSLYAYYLKLKIKLRLLINIVELLIYTFFIVLNNLANLEKINTIVIIFTVLYLIINVPLALYSIKSKIIINIAEIFIYGFFIRFGYLIIPEQIFIPILGFAVSYLIINLSLLICDAIKLTSIIKQSSKYVFSYAVLSEMHPKMLGRFFFTVNITDENTNERKINTTAIFSSVVAPRFENWQNLEVLIAYDPVKSKAFVIGAKEDFPDIPEN